jgi:hypothetical protein
MPQGGSKMRSQKTQALVTRPNGCTGHTACSVGLSINHADAEAIPAPPSQVKGVANPVAIDRAFVTDFYRAMKAISL